MEKEEERKHFLDREREKKKKRKKRRAKTSRTMMYRGEKKGEGSLFITPFNSAEGSEHS